jgi:hypothetical protein
MTAANYCVVLERWKSWNSPLAFLLLEEILCSEGVRGEVVVAILGVFGLLLDQLKDAEFRANRSLDVDQVTRALDEMNIDDVVEVLKHAVTLLKEAKEARDKLQER